MITQRRLSETVAAKKIKIGFISLSAATQVYLLKSEVTDSDKKPMYWVGNPGKLQSCFTQSWNTYIKILLEQAL
ncbi:MAG: hypothetical protein ACTHM5_03870 [Ginsengibacter sp.]